MSVTPPSADEVIGRVIHDQHRAADPAASAWVSANAGSGKTTVLANRVLRLLLAGAEPGRILCLTFTKAAAANMSNRVFDDLGRWVALDDAALDAALLRLTGKPPTADLRAVARRLFARAIETPGGLKIETIHAFCERVLHLFPFEANVPARFEVLDDTDAADLLARARVAVISDAIAGRAPALAAALARLVEEAGDVTIDKALAEALRAKALLRQGLSREPGPSGGGIATDAIKAALGLEPADDRASVERQMLGEGIPEADWPDIITALAAGKTTDQALADCFRAALAATNPADKLAAYQSVFFTQAGEPRSDSRFGTKAIDPDLVQQLRDERDRLAGLTGRLKAVLAVERTAALLTLASAVFTRVEASKNARGALDFDDLIARTVDLFARHEAAWVLYKLDAGIDHILVDEAQDTSPEQWRILKALAEEFTAGDSAALTRRTLFAVGDPKQSIYGFQGAAPREFDDSGRYFRRRVEAAGQAFEDVRLTVSFRSAPEVLKAVDAVFADPQHFQGLSFDDDAVGTVHESARPQLAGLVEFWEAERPTEVVDAEAWTLPVDELEEGSPQVRLARRIARAVKHWTGGGDDGRRFSPGDILILVRKRGGFYESLIRALKDTGLPVAGADRLKVTEHIAVRDLVAAGRAALLPADDLTLAALLKSPLVGLDDDDLMRIGAERPEEQSLDHALALAAEAGNERAVRAVGLLADWRQRARRGGPFAFYAHLIGPGGGRRRLVARLGAEAGDAIDEFMAAALGYERRQAPSLAGFLVAFGEAEREVKRDLEDGHDEIRVMTVHGAKGLEAPVVILADGCDVPTGRTDPKLFAIAGRDGPALPIWSPRSELDPAAVAGVRDRLRREAEEEHNRLLYVAMTRAKERLVVASYTSLGRDAKTGDFRPLPEKSWPAMIRKGLEAGAYGLVEAPAPHGNGTVWRWRDPARPASPSAPPAAAAVALPSLPAWLDRRLPPEAEARPPLRPSSALGAADQLPEAAGFPSGGPLAGPLGAPPRSRRDEDARRAARLGGDFLHKLLQHLPEGLMRGGEAMAREIAALLEVRATGLDAATRDGIVTDALAVLARPDLAALFGPSSRAEVPIAGAITIDDEAVPVSGQIDRLAVTADAVHVADFKTSHWPPATLDAAPASHLAQLAVYAALLAEIYPDRPVRAFLVYTRGPRVFKVPPEALEAALMLVKQA
ncbi:MULTISPECIES: double-strand break repair helicase AddA [unclassified Chelatococcus]|uniref:double-strand break repair helicase AddA n=3 Tax=Chelatococcus TaxID=28209 RepID=UPI001BCE2C8D|nr:MULTISPECIES: double-strand break repair helicase AddA [unclassified Chelatococcus]MBS7740618.1 double-strand break repair helicase AddA [Chelatococcus sp. HY11]MBX3544598.1 double-strand break repair helicase AddA [Chelatococcus sp.]CAH1656987.1 DNA helicase [Hyphomicrobiales bacterium]CAH1684564.1 DNA helicase [Hyphomicrobiales bacterium]